MTDRAREEAAGEVWWHGPGRSPQRAQDWNTARRWIEEMGGYASSRPTPPAEIAAGTEVARLREALAKVMPIRVHDGPDYAEVYFADGAAHSTQAMTMNPADWRAVQSAWEALSPAIAADARASDAAPHDKGER